MIVHLENHCSIKQQKVMAHLLKTLLGSYLYIHPKDSPKPLTDLSPDDLKYKIILKVSAVLSWLFSPKDQSLVKGIIIIESGKVGRL